MEDEDGTCLLDVLCDPQALNDFLHGTNELQTEDLLINSSSGEASLFTDAPSPVSLLGDGRDSPDTPPPGCVDLSFLEEALLSSPEAGEENSQELRGPGTPAQAIVFEATKKGEVDEEEGEEEGSEMACDILQQSLQEAEITEQTMALEAGLAQSGDSLSLYSPTPLLSPPTLPFKHVTLRDTQAAVEPPQPSLLAVGPGCPSLKPAAPPQLMGLLPGNVFPAASPETSFSLSPAQASSMIIHKAVPSVTGRPFFTQTLRTSMAATPGLVFQRAPLPIQPKMPISIQPRLVQISPKFSGQKHTPGLTFVPGGNASPNILLSQPPKPSAPPQLQHQTTQHLHKQVSLQLVNQGGSFVLQPQGLFQGQNQFLLPGQSPLTISQQARPMLTPTHHQGLSPSTGQLLDGTQILTVPQRQLNFGPVFTTPTGQLALRQATVLSGPLQLQSAPPTVFQMPAQLAGTYAPGGQGQRATLVHHSPALGNHITLINSSVGLPSDLTSISIVNGTSMVQGLPFAAQAAAPQTGEGQLSLQQASVVLLPERAIQEERTSSEETFHPLPQSYGHVLQHISVQAASAGLQSSSPPVVTVLQPPEPLLAPDPAVEIPKLLMPPADMTQVVEEVTHSLSPNEAFMQHLQQQALSSPIPPELLVGSLPVVPMDSLASPVPNELETHPQSNAVSGPDSHQCVEASPHLSEPEEQPLICSPTPIQDSERQDTRSFSPSTGPQIPLPGPESSTPQITDVQPHIEPQTQYQVPHQLQASQDLFAQNQIQSSLPQVQVESYVSAGDLSVHSSPPPPSPPLCVPVPQQSPGPTAVSASLSTGGGDSAVQQHTQNKPTAALVVESEAFSLDVHPPSPAPQGVQVHGPSAPTEMSQQTGTKLACLVEQQREERLTPAMRRHRFQQQICLDHAAVQTSVTGPAFSSLKGAVTRLLPYHTCAGPLPTQDDFNLVDQEFDTVSGFLLKRTKDMVNKYRQLLVREAQQESPSAEMVMLERLFLQAERCALTEDRRKVRRDPESFMMALATSSSSPRGAPSSSPPAWTRLSDRPPGLRTYRSSSRGALRLTIKQESGSRKVVHNSACDPALKRDHMGQQLTNGGGSVIEESQSQTLNGATQHLQHDEDFANGTEEVSHTTPDFKIKALNPPPMLDPQETGSLELLPPRDVSAPKLKCYRLDTSPRFEQRFSPPPAPIQEDNMLSEHLQSAIDSILELQRLQGPSAAPNRATSGPTLDQTVTSILEGHL